MSIQSIKRGLRDEILDAAEAGETIDKGKMIEKIIKRLSSASHYDLAHFAAKRLVGECVGQIKQSKIKAVFN